MFCGMRKLLKLKIEMVHGVQWCKNTRDEQRGVTSKIRKGFCACGRDNGSHYKGEKKSKTSKGVRHAEDQSRSNNHKSCSHQKKSKLIHLEIITLTIDEWEKICC